MVEFESLDLPRTRHIDSDTLEEDVTRGHDSSFNVLREDK